PRPELRVLNAAAQTRIISVARIRLEPWKSVPPFKGIFCDDISESSLTCPARQSDLCRPCQVCTNRRDIPQCFARERCHADLHLEWSFTNGEHSERQCRSTSITLPRARERLHSVFPNGLESARGGKKFDQSFSTFNLSRAGHDSR